MKTILLINISARKGNTWNLLLQIENLLKDHGFSTEIVNLFDYRIENCLGCQKCVARGSCCINDDVPALMQKMLGCDGIVLSSPVYIDNVCGRLKTFADRTYEWYHAPKMAGKPALYAATSNATGGKQIKQAFRSISISWGAPHAGSVTRTARDINKPVNTNEIKDFIRIMDEGNRIYNPSFYEINIFQVKKVMAQQSEGFDNEYWKSHNLLDKAYYNNCKLSFLKKVFSKIIYNILKKAME